MAVETPSEKKSVPDGLWRKCDSCHELIYNKDLENNFMVCRNATTILNSM